MTDLQGKVAIVTGAASGMGAEYARRFVSDGASVVLTDTDAVGGQAVAGELDRAVFVEQDVTVSDDWRSVVKTAEAVFGDVTVLVNNAGIIGTLGFSHEATEEEFERIWQVHVTGTFLGIKHVVPGMIRAGGGSIVNVSSVAGMTGLRGTHIAYVASKFAVRGMAKQIASTYGSRNIRCNSVHPGFVETPMMQVVTEMGYDFTKTVPLRRLASTHEVASLVAFLASDDASYVSGAEYVIDGGLTSSAPFPM